MVYTSKQLFELAQEHRRSGHFGEAVNAFRQAASASDATEEIKKKSLASIELIQEINAFVNVDLMNP